MAVRVTPITLDEIERRIAELEAKQPDPESDDGIDLELYRAALRLRPAR